jgi:hypothetical protein
MLVRDGADSDESIHNAPHRRELRDDGDIPPYLHYQLVEYLEWLSMSTAGKLWPNQ